MTEQLLEIPGYQVHGRLGKGGMAEVYLATQASLQRKVAIKVLLSADDQAFSQRFLKEGHIVASLHHPSIITIYDIDQLADGRHYLTMEFVPGGDLAQHKGEAFDLPRALRIVQQVASGLAVVAFDDGAASEHIRNEENGMKVHLEDDEGFVDCALRLADQPTLLGRLRNQARLDALELNWSAQIEQFEQLVLNPDNKAGYHVLNKQSISIL